MMITTIDGWMTGLEGMCRRNGAVVEEMPSFHKYGEIEQWLTNFSTVVTTEKDLRLNPLAKKTQQIAESDSITKIIIIPDSISRDEAESIIRRVI